MSIDRRVARFEADLGELKRDAAKIAENVRRLQELLVTANQEISAIRKEFEMMHWFIITMLLVGIVAFTAAKLLH